MSLCYLLACAEKFMGIFQCVCLFLSEQDFVDGFLTQNF